MASVIKFTESLLVIALWCLTVVASYRTQQHSVGIYRVVLVGSSCGEVVSLYNNKGAVFTMSKSSTKTQSCKVLFHVNSGSTVFVSGEQMSLGSGGACLSLSDGNALSSDWLLQHPSPEQHLFCNDTLFKFQSSGSQLTVEFVSGSSLPEEVISFRLALTPVSSDCTYQFQCDSGECIPREMEADGHRNCPDNSDEKNTPTATGSPKCGSNLESCDSGQCIARTSVCDRFKDCLDSSDEQDCLYLCSSTYSSGGSEYACENGQECFREYHRCDDYHSCEDGTDDKYCDSCDVYPPSMEDVLFCEETHTCLSLDEICDNVINCPNGQDEREELCYPNIYSYWTSGQLAGLFIGYIIFLVIVIAIVVVVHKRCRKEVP